jgi:hypothetical protein
MTENYNPTTREDSIIIAEIADILKQFSFPDDFIDRHSEFKLKADKLLALLIELSSTDNATLKTKSGRAAEEIFHTIKNEVAYIDTAYKEMNKKNATKQRIINYKQSIRRAASLLCSDAGILTI